MPEPQSMHELLDRLADESPNAPGYRLKTDGDWVDVSWDEARRTTRRIAKSLMALGVAKGDRVAILSQSRFEWVLADFGIMGCGGVTVGIYPSNLAPDCAYIINHSDSVAVFAENAEQVEKLVAENDAMQTLQKVVVYDGGPDPDNGVLGWDEFLELGSKITDDALNERARSVVADDLASLVYTSGTTGVPKGAMITHGNLLFSSQSAMRSMAIEAGDVTLLFLPLAHVFARLMAHTCLRYGATLAFAEDISMVPANLREVRPNFLASVPRIYEKFYNAITTGAREAGGLKEKIFDWAIGVGLRVSRLEQQKRPVPPALRLQRALAQKLVFVKIQAAFGGNLRWAISGAAPLNTSIAEFFHACGVLILEGIGMTENTSFSNVNRFDNNKFGTVGEVGPGIEMRIAEDGEVLFRGPNVMKGYFKNPEATAETIDANGWLHSGDVGEIDGDGFLKITDRKKDLIITAGGKNVAPQRIERTLRASSYLSQVVAIGDRRRFISALVTLDPDDVGKWCRSRGIEATTLEDLAQNQEVQELIAAEIEKFNSDLASFESVKKFRIVPAEFTVEGGELTPTLKIKRKAVEQKYAALIEEMYRG